MSFSSVGNPNAQGDIIIWAQKDTILSLDPRKHYHGPRPRETLSWFHVELWTLSYHESRSRETLSSLAQAQGDNIMSPGRHLSWVHDQGATYHGFRPQAYSVLNLWENQRRGQQCVFDLFWLFLGGQYKLGSWEAPEGVKPPPPDKSSTAPIMGPGPGKHKSWAHNFQSISQKYVLNMYWTELS